MKHPRGIRNLFWAVVFGAVIVSMPMALSAQAFNLAKEATDKKIFWKDAPADSIPRDVCTILQACGGQNKWIVQPPATEAGGKVARGMFKSLSRDGKTDVYILYRQTATDRYFMELTADGGLQKAAFVQLGSTSWSPIATSLAQPTFDKEKMSWHNYIGKLGSAPAAPAPQSN
jgi:hypothetical protein